jgi:hypothetical protein
MRNGNEMISKYSYWEYLYLTHASYRNITILLMPKDINEMTIRQKLRGVDYGF